MEWYTEDSVSFELPDGSQIRITCGGCSEFDIATYRTRCAAARTYLNETYGLDADAWRSDDIVASLGDHFSEWSILTEWASMLAAFRKLERRLAENDQWEEVVGLPDAWTKPATGPRSIPAVMFRAWVNLVNELNPGVFTVAQSNTAKKSVRLIVNP